ncbi:conserved hypothetical protein [Desulfofarcimen acetoxidans DSM 771]|uniref:MobA-like NTP transferase domain-containing protein n=1 Tax=Desulfofarcimen acetoxidans (strain ATCC 49208 / DSM 771 / KCTC 5769 / VKM B-1644 / 5575) TaxID=485916 RepID=C8W300_DESAS|nr:nucleotidyltransferase family protein [Desulfofarcimen acetoxidans]ACV61156.1 conserved hypothetical protein [Desulfofarcimen acetoxidans DSM 771]
MVDAVVLAGSVNNGKLRAISDVPYDALLPIGSKFMIEYVLEALLRARLVNRVIVAGPGNDPSQYLNKLLSNRNNRVKTAPAGASLMETFSSGVALLPGAERVLVVTADLPLLTPEAVDCFIELCLEEAADLFYPIISREAVERCYSKTHRTYVTLREGVYTGGNIFLVNPSAAKTCLHKGQEIVNLRKSPFKLCRLVGFMFLLRFLTKTLSLEEGERKVSSLLGIKGRVIVLDYPEVGVDVDKPEDLELVKQVLGVV